MRALARREQTERRARRQSKPRYQPRARPYAGRLCVLAFAKFEQVAVVGAMLSGVPFWSRCLGGDIPAVHAAALGTQAHPHVHFHFTPTD